MKRFRGPWGLAWWGLLCLLISAACSNPDGLNSDRGTQASQPQVPFRGSNPAGSTPPDAATAVPPSGSTTNLPFRDSDNLPAGTLLTVRLKTPISANDPGDDTFTAEIDEPVVMEGNVFLPRGTSVTGRVEFSQSPEGKGNRGYFRLTLNAIELAGTPLPVQTSKLFARGHTPEGVSALEKGHRLTFRLAEPVYLAKQQASPHQ